MFLVIIIKKIFCGIRLIIFFCLFNELGNIICFSFIIYKIENCNYLFKNVGKVVFFNIYKRKCYSNVLYIESI